MRSHGWSGHTPSSDEEAIERILDGAEQLLDESGAAMRIADVARAVGVTRQTVYRYFPSTESLRMATVLRSADGFLDQMANRLAGETNPVAALTGGLAFTIETLGADNQLELLLRGHSADAHSLSLTSDTALSFARAMLHRVGVDWARYGFDDAALDELAEFSLRILHSFITDPGEPARRGAELRRFLTRWVGPAITYPVMADALSSLSQDTVADSA